MNNIRLSQRDGDILGVVQLAADLPATTIATRTGHAVHTVHYSLLKLAEKGVISPFPFINVYPIGYEQYGIFFSLAGTASVRQKVIDSLVKSPQVSWILSLGGDFQYGIGLCVKRSYEVTDFLRGLAEDYGDIFFEKSVAVRVSCTLFPRLYLSTKIKPSRPLHYGDIGNSVEIDVLDHYILRAITSIAHSSIRELAQELGVPHTTIQARLSKLRDAKILSGIAMGINPTLIGMHPFRLLLYVTKVSAGLREAVYKFASQHPNVFAFIECVGSWDYELKVEVESPAALSRVTDALYDRFGHTLHTVKTLTVLGTQKLAFYPFLEPDKIGAKSPYSNLSLRMPKLSRPAWD